MKTLDEHNRERDAAYTASISREPRPNGIACPLCKKELLDTHPQLLLNSAPPEKDVHCQFCGYRGYRLA